MSDIWQRVVQRFSPKSNLLRSWQLTGGVSAQVTALELQHPDGGREKWVVRQHGAADRAANPEIAADEFHLLQGLHAAGLPVQRPLYLDTLNAIIPQPYIVLTYIEGQTSFAPDKLMTCIEQMAAALAQIHRVHLGKHDFSFLPDVGERVTYRLQQRSAEPRDDLHETRIRKTLDAAWPWHSQNITALLHGDYWPGNLLWHDERLAAVIDWEDAALGDPLYDLATARLEIFWAHGEAALKHFTEHYQARLPQLDYARLPHWDLYAALRPIADFTNWAEDEVAAQSMRQRHMRFTTRAFAQLSDH